MKKEPISIQIIKKAAVLSSIAVPALVFAQTVEVKGKIQNAAGAPVSYASIELYTLTSPAKMQDAGLSDDAGNFVLNVPPGRYRAKIDAVGYSLYEKEVSITGGNIPPIILTEAEAKNTKVLQEVVITATTTRPYKVELDKKTYDVAQDLTAKGGNLQDVLQNVPSVQVDADGSIAMRGSSNVRFLVNGKPSALLGFGDGPAALQSIPAEQIERIEVITNPSSKFEASGTAGILNIILKKEKRTGFNGSVQGSLGYLPQTGLNVNLGWRKGDWSWFLNGGGSYRESQRVRDEERLYLNPSASNPLSRSITDSNFKNSMDSYNVSAGAVVDLSEKTSLNFSGTARLNKSHNYGGARYTDVYTSGISSIRDRNEDSNADNAAYQADLGFEHNFEKKGHLLTASLSYQINNSDSNGNYTENLNNVSVEKSFERRLDNNKNIIGKIDYELPIGEKSKLEAGYRFDRNSNTAENTAALNDLTTGTALDAKDFNYFSDYTETFNAAYAQFKSSVGKLGYQVGLRNEHSLIDIQYRNADNSSSLNKSKNYNGLFPSVYLSYNISNNSQLLANYTRRIDRPRSWFLRPNASIQDIRSVFRGNPDLNPSYTDSFEFGYSYQTKKITINPTLYYRHQTDDVKMVVFRENSGSFTTYTLPMNIGEDFRYGLDLNFNIEAASWLRFMGNFDVFGYKTTGTYTYNLANPDGTQRVADINYDGNGMATNARLAATIKVDKSFSIQIQGDRRGGRKTAQQSIQPIYGLNFGLSKNIWNGNGTLAFNVQDAFNSRFRKTSTNTGDIISNSEMQFRPRNFMLSLTYRFKQGAENKKVIKKRDKNSAAGMDDDMDM